MLAPAPLLNPNPQAQIQGLQARIETLVAEMRDLDAKLDRLTGINDTQTKVRAARGRP